MQIETPKKSRIIGIDLGTTFSEVAYIDESGRPRCIPDEEGHVLLPSVVTFLESGEVEVGWGPRRTRVVNARRTAYSVKRFMGKGKNEVLEVSDILPYQIVGDESGALKLRVAGVDYTPTEVSAHILKALKKRAEEHLGEGITKAVITVPAYFNDGQRQATKDAGKIAGLDVLRIINEPTAASLAYGLDRRKEGIIAVYDLGGGTFDISILKLREGVFEVLATNGNTLLGGDNFDERISAVVLRELAERYGEELVKEPEVLQAVRDEAEAAKIRLSDADETALKLYLSHEGVDYQRELTREEMEGLILDLVERTRRHCQQAMADAGIAPEGLDEVVLVGGATRMPLVRRIVEGIFHRKPMTDLNPEEVVALGAAIQADILAGGRRDMLLLDVTPLSLGIETLGGAMGWLIQRNTTIPCSATEVFTTFVDGQTSVVIHVLQGEREMTKDNRGLAKFELTGIEPLPAGVPRIEVTFHIDANGMLQVTARDQRTGKAQSVEVKPTYGLTDEEVERMIVESVEYAQADLEERQLAELRNDATTVLSATEKALVESPHLLNEEERKTIEEALAALKGVLEGRDIGLIRERLDGLARATTEFANRILSDALAQRAKAQVEEQASEQGGLESEEKG